MAGQGTHVPSMGEKRLSHRTAKATRGAIYQNRLHHLDHLWVVGMIVIVGSTAPNVN